MRFPGGPEVKNPPANAEDSLIPRSGTSPRRGNGNPLQYFCWDNPMYRGAGGAAVHGVTESEATEHAHLINPPSIVLSEFLLQT